MQFIAVHHGDGEDGLFIAFVHGVRMVERDVDFRLGDRNGGHQS